MSARWCVGSDTIDRKSTRLNSSHTVIFTLSLHDALPIFISNTEMTMPRFWGSSRRIRMDGEDVGSLVRWIGHDRSEEHTSELQSHSDLHSFPTRRSSDLHQQHRDDHAAVLGFVPADSNGRGRCRLAGALDRTR